jgi:putative oxidoreductase
MTLKDHYRTLRHIGDTTASTLSWLPPLLARVTIGVVFVQSGWGKLNHLDMAINNFRNWGIPAPEFQAPFAAASELLFGGLVLVGLFTRFAAIPLIIIMIVALKTVAFEPAKAVEDGTLNYLFGLIEYLYIVILAWLAVYGPGPASIDQFIPHSGSAKK